MRKRTNIPKIDNFIGRVRAFWTCALLVVLLLTSCSTNSSDLDSWAEQGEISKVGDFVSNRLHAEQSSKVVVHGVDILADVEADSMLRAIGSEVDQDIPKIHAEALIKALNQRSLVPASPGRLCKSVLDEELEVAGVRKVLHRYKDSRIKKCLSKHLIKYNKKSGYGVLHEKLNSLVNNYGEISPNLNKIKTIAKKLKTKGSKLSKIENNISDIQKSIKRSENNIEKLRNKKESTKLLDGYVVGLVEEYSFGKVYEFAFTDFRGNPTNERGYLLTKETNFSSKGLFRMRVSKIKEVETKVKDEMGGFKQSWPLFSEVNGYKNLPKKIEKESEKVTEEKNKLYRAIKRKGNIESEIGKYRKVVKKYLKGRGEGIVYGKVGARSSKAERPSAKSGVTMYRGGPQRSGVYGGSGPEEPVKKKWSAAVEGRVALSPAVVSGTVFIGSAGGTVYAFDAETGQERWSSKIGDRAASSPAVVENTVYIGGDDTIYAFDVETGEEEWRYPVTNVFSSKVVAVSSPAVVNGTVYFGSWDNYVYALDAETGKEQWRFKTGDRVASPPAVAQGTVYVGSYDQNVYALDAETGEEQWRFETGKRVTSSPAVVDGLVYLCSDDVHALDAETGEEQWRFETENIAVSSPAVTNETVYFGDTEGHLRALDAETGLEQWRFNAGIGVSAPTVAGGSVYFLGKKEASSHYDNYAETCALDAENGRKEWCFKTGARSTHSVPAVVGGTVYVHSSQEDSWRSGVAALR